MLQRTEKKIAIMDTCIMRNYGNFVPRENLSFGHVVLILHKHKDDLFLNVMDKYLRHSAHVTILLSCKTGRNRNIYQNNPQAEYFSSKLRETIQLISTPRAYIENQYTAMYRPSITVTDDLESEKYLQKYCPQYYNYVSNHFCQLNISSCIKGLNLAHPTDLSNFDHQLSLFSCNYLRYKVCIKTIIQILPPCFIFYTAFGDYKQPLRFQEIINSFNLFKYKYRKYYGHEIMLVLGGEYFTSVSTEGQNRKYLRSSLERLRKDHNVIFLKKNLNQSEKKTLLRLSYAAIYLDSNNTFGDIQFAMSLGTPIICSNIGHGANMVDHGISGFIVQPERIDIIASYMEALSIPTVYHRFNTAARMAYLKKYSESSMFLQTVSVDEIPNFTTPEIGTKVRAPFTSVINSDFNQSITNLNIHNDWYVKNEYSAVNKHQSVFGEGTARNEYENHIKYCEKQIREQKQFYVHPNIELYPEFTFEYVALPRWSEEDKVCDQMYGYNLLKMKPVGQVKKKDKQPNNQDIQPPSVDTHKRPTAETCQPPPSELHKRPLFKSSAELNQPPLVKDSQPPSDGNYQPPVMKFDQRPPVKLSVKPQELPPIGQYISPPDHSIESQKDQLYSKETVQLQKLSMKQLQNLPMLQLQNLSMSQFQNESMQLHPNEPLQSYETMQPNPNKIVPLHQSILQPIVNHSPLVTPNQQSFRPYCVGIKKQHPKQNPKPQLIAPNQPGWFQMPSTLVDSQSSESKRLTPRPYFQPEGVQIVNYKESDENDSARRWKEVFDKDSVDECSAHGAQDAWSGIRSDDIGTRSFRVFNISNLQQSDDWEEANLDSGDKIQGKEIGIQYYGHETNDPLDVGKVTVESGYKETRQEQGVEQLHTEVDVKLEDNQDIDTFPTHCKLVRRNAKKRRVKKIRPERD